jgi:hypothetical protein
VCQGNLVHEEPSGQTTAKKFTHSAVLLGPKAYRGQRYTNTGAALSATALGPILKLGYTRLPPASRENALLYTLGLS